MQSTLLDSLFRPLCDAHNWAGAMTVILAVLIVGLSALKDLCYLAGLTTVFIVVLFVGLLQNTVSRAPLIFLRLAETTVSEAVSPVFCVFHVIVSSICRNESVSSRHVITISACSFLTTTLAVEKIPPAKFVPRTLNTSGSRNGQKNS